MNFINTAFASGLQELVDYRITNFLRSFELGRVSATSPNLFSVTLTESEVPGSLAADEVVDNFFSFALEASREFSSFTKNVGVEGAGEDAVARENDDCATRRSAPSRV